MVRQGRKILIPGDFDAFLTEPVSLNGATSWEPEWIIDDLMLKGGFNIIGGAPKVGKSLLRSHVLVSAIAGCPTLSHFKTHPIKKALLMAGEESVEVEEARIRKAANGLGFKESEIPIQIIPQRGFFFDDYDSFDNFVPWVLDKKFDLVCIDPLIRWHRANESASGELSPILSNLRILCHEGVTISLIHHTGKPKEGQEDWPIGYLLRGSSDLAAIYDHLIIIKTTTGGKLRREILTDSRPSESLDPFKIDLQIDDTSLNWSVHKTTVQAIRDWFPLLDPRNHQSVNQVAKAVHRRKEDVSTILQSLEKQGFIRHDDDGYYMPGVPS